MSKKNTVTSSHVLNVLAEKHWPTPAHAMLREVRNGTGYGASRSADALIVSLWPSRGIWFAGVEVKVSRSDWRSELKNPAKADEIGQYCDYWWLAAAPDVVLPAELPETWGLVEVTAAGAVSVIKPAAKMMPKPLEAGFVAAVMRNMATSHDRLRSTIRSELTSQGGDVSAELARLKIENADLERRLRDAKDRLDGLRHTVAKFEKASGCSIASGFAPSVNARAFEVARKALSGDYSRLTNALKRAVDDVAEAERQLAALAPAIPDNDVAEEVAS